MTHRQFCTLLLVNIFLLTKNPEHFWRFFIYCPGRTRFNAYINSCESRYTFKIVLCGKYWATRAQPTLSRAIIKRNISVAYILGFVQRLILSPMTSA